MLQCHLFQNEFHVRRRLKCAHTSFFRFRNFDYYCNIPVVNNIVEYVIVTNGLADKNIEETLPSFAVFESVTDVLRLRDTEPVDVCDWYCARRIAVVGTARDATVAI